MCPIDPTAALSAGFTPSSSPPVAPDGGPILTPAPVRLAVIQPMSLCELGPCRNLHVLVQRIDAQTPIDGSSAPTRTSTIHTCYPAPGIEYDLTSEPVRKCSRWEPMTSDELYDRNNRRAGWNPVGMYRAQWAEFLESWEASASDADDSIFDP